MFEYHCVIPNCTHSLLRGLHFSSTNLLTHIPLISFLFKHTQQLLHAYTYNMLYQTHAHTCTNLNIHPQRLPCGIQSQCSWLESLSTASDVTSARSVSCAPLLLLPPTTPFLFPILFHQLSPSFDTSEGVPHMPVTSPLLHRHFLPSSLSRARVSVWNLCTL